MDRALRSSVRERARGRCEYCGSPESESELRFPVDHIIARQHGGETILNNLALACSSCNYHKGPNVGGIDPEAKQPAPLFNPRSDQWHDHFRWDGLQIIGRTAVGRTTVMVLKMNSPRQLAIRLALLRSGWVLSDLT
jgi:hypothetical protein